MGGEGRIAVASAAVGVVPQVTRRAYVALLVLGIPIPRPSAVAD
jgi:hypothetical protein